MTAVSSSLSRRRALRLGTGGLAAGLATRGLSLAAAQEATPPADLEANKALAHRFHDEIFEQGNLDTADEILAPDFTWYSPPDEPLVGPEGVKEAATGLREFFPDVVLTDDEVIAEGNHVVIRWTLTGTAQTETGPVPVSFTGIDIFRIADGKLVELWQNTDGLGLEQQLSAGAAAGTPAATPAP